MQRALAHRIPIFLYCYCTSKYSLLFRRPQGKHHLVHGDLTRGMFVLNKDHLTFLHSHRMYSKHI